MNKQRIDNNATLRKKNTLNGNATEALTYHEYLSLKEPAEHGSIDFPLKVYEINTLTWLRERIWCHWHDEIEFVLVTHGSAHFQINDTIYDIKENDIVIVPPNSLHFATQDVGQAFDFIAVVLSLDFISSAHNDVIHQKYITPLLNHQLQIPQLITANPLNAENHLNTITDDANKISGNYSTCSDFAKNELYKNNIHNILYIIRELYLKKPFGYELDIKSYVFKLWHQVVELSVSTQEVTTDSLSKSLTKTNQIKEILAYLKSHYTETLSLKDIADVFHLSEGHLCRMFKDVTGKTLTDYLNYYRITMSTALLLKTDTDISQIAVRVGFNNVSYFNKTFKKYMNKTPGEFRKTEGNYL